MEYKGKHIDENNLWNARFVYIESVTVKDDYFMADYDKLEKWQQRLVDMSMEFVKKGIEFRNLSIGFEVSHSEDDNDEYEAWVGWHWEQLETNGERDERIEREKRKIDEYIEATDFTKDDGYSFAKCSAAAEYLKKYGYDVTKVSE